ncbi:hypothetical protein ACFL6F_03550, partial [Planctomycetota bacterium]
DETVNNDTTYYYVVTGVDKSGNESENSVEASATPQDTTKPWLAITTPDWGDLYGGTGFTGIQIEGNVYDNVAVTSFTINGDLVTVTNNAFTHTITFTEPTEGWITIQAVAQDAAGNQSSDTVKVKVDTKAPVVSISGVIPGDNKGILIFSCSDFTDITSLSSTVTGEITLENVVWPEGKDGLGYYAFQGAALNYTLANPVLYDVQLTATDEKDNTGQSAMVEDVVFQAPVDLSDIYRKVVTLLDIIGQTIPYDKNSSVSPGSLLGQILALYNLNIFVVEPETKSEVPWDLSIAPYTAWPTNLQDALNAGAILQEHKDFLQIMLDGNSEGGGLKWVKYTPYCDRDYDRLEIYSADLDPLMWEWRTDNTIEVNHPKPYVDPLWIELNNLYIVEEPEMWWWNLETITATFGYSPIEIKSKVGYEWWFGTTYTFQQDWYGEIYRRADKLHLSFGKHGDTTQVYYVAKDGTTIAKDEDGIDITGTVLTGNDHTESTSRTIICYDQTNNLFPAGATPPVPSDLNSEINANLYAYMYVAEEQYDIDTVEFYPEGERSHDQSNPMVISRNYTYNIDASARVDMNGSYCWIPLVLDSTSTTDFDCVGMQPLQPTGGKIHWPDIDNETGKYVYALCSSVTDTTQKRLEVKSVDVDIKIAGEDHPDSPGCGIGLNDPPATAPIDPEDDDLVAGEIVVYTGGIDCQLDVTIDSANQNVVLWNPDGTAFDMSRTITGDNETVTIQFLTEGIALGTSFIKAQMNPLSATYTVSPIEDIENVCVVSLELVVPDETYNNGEDPDAGRVPSEFFILSNPYPTIELDEVSSYDK